MLGLLALVALWFWAPLVCGWFGGEESASQQTTESPVADIGQAAWPRVESPPATTTKKDEQPTPPWDKLVEWIEQDARTVAADCLGKKRDPFQPVKKEQVAKKDDEEKPETKPQQPIDTPESLGLVLASTIVGPARRTALVNGKVYPQGGDIKLDKDGREIVFKLAEVYPTRIVLAREGKRFEVKLMHRVSSDAIELTKSRN